MTATSTTRAPDRSLSTIGALLLAIAGNILVVVIAVTAFALVAVAGLVVFGAEILRGI